MIPRTELATGIREHPDLEATEPREIAELISQVEEWGLIWEHDGVYRTGLSNEERQSERERKIEEMATEFEDL